MERNQKLELLGKMTGHNIAMRNFLQGEILAEQAVAIVDDAILAQPESCFRESILEDFGRAKSAFQACVEHGLNREDFQFD